MTINKTSFRRESHKKLLIAGTFSPLLSARLEQLFSITGKEIHEQNITRKSNFYLYFNFLLLNSEC